MRLFAYLASLMLFVGGRVRDRLRADPDDDRGDVPGWVMVTVETAA